MIRYSSTGTGMRIMKYGEEISGQENHVIGLNGRVVTDMMPYIILRGCCCDVIVLHGPTENKDHDTKDRSYEELESLFVQFSKYYMEMLKKYFNANEDREDILKPVIGNENLHEMLIMIMELES
jgi:hypothetical protein